MNKDMLSDVVRLLRDNLSLIAVILFGSRARKDWGPWSDYDLLIIADFQEKYLDRIGNILGILKKIKIPIEPHPYTLEEAISMLRNGNPIIIDAIEEGKILYASQKLEKLYEEYHKLKRRGLTRTHTTIIIPTEPS
ncbi:MAG: nucleotidyltransferase domain-containing protein [Candidatus Njordarchaeota archaeon]